MGDIAIGQVFTADSLQTHQGRLSATPNHKVVVVFLGTCPSNTVPRVMPVLKSLGWVRGDFYEVALDIVKDGERKSSRTVYQCEDPLEACEAAARFAHRQAYVENEKSPGWALDALLLNVVRFGEIDDEGHPQNTRGEILLEWKQSLGTSLEAAIEKLRPHGSTNPD